ncbi:MAG: class I SAM-dependent methyltransferase [Erysipelotrichaceae bacterium]
MNEIERDLELHIQTSSIQNLEEATTQYHRYEPTEYVCLDALLPYIQVAKDTCLVDIGCGFGRVSFYFYHHLQCHCKGIDYNANFIEAANHNRSSYETLYGSSDDKLIFIHGLAQDLEILEHDTLFYFFNPFSLVIFQAVLDRLIQAAHKFQRSFDLIFYYPNPEYTMYLDTLGLFALTQSVNIPNRIDPRECFVIYHYLGCEEGI